MEVLAINKEQHTWQAACRVDDIPADGGACALLKRAPDCHF